MPTKNQPEDDGMGIAIALMMGISVATVATLTFWFLQTVGMN